MQLEARKYLYDIQQAAELVAQFTVGKAFADYQREPMIRLAVERGFEIIGEALSQLAKLDGALAAHQPEECRISRRRAKASRNRNLHLRVPAVRLGLGNPQQASRGTIGTLTSVLTSHMLK